VIISMICTGHTVPMEIKEILLLVQQGLLSYFAPLSSW